MDRGHKGLRALLQHMGARRKPVIPFLSRNHLVNRFLGRIRHDLKSSGKKKRR
jgi:hypothetical protein